MHRRRKPCRSTRRVAQRCLLGLQPLTKQTVTQLVVRMSYPGSRGMGKMNISYTIKAIAVVALLVFNMYMAHQNKDDRIRIQWKNIIAAIVLVYVAGKSIDEFAII
jgi:hypothetical protein